MRVFMAKVIKRNVKQKNKTLTDLQTQREAQFEGPRLSPGEDSNKASEILKILQ